MQAHAFEASLARETRLHEQGSIRKSAQGGKEQVKQLRASQEAAVTLPKEYNEPEPNRIRRQQSLLPSARTKLQIVLESIQEPAPGDWEEVDIYTSDKLRICSICHRTHSCTEVTLAYIGWICVECCRLLAECREIELSAQESQAANTEDLNGAPDASCFSNS